MTAAIIPTYQEHAADLAHVLRTVAPLVDRTAVVVQGVMDVETRRVTREANHVIHYPSGPIGKGKAVRVAARQLEQDFIVLDADLHSLDVDVLTRSLEAVKAGCWTRTVHPTPGRLSARIPAVLDSLSIDYPRDLVSGGLLCQIAGYPWEAWATLDDDTLPDHYGFDLAVALDLYRAGHPYAAIEAPERAHRMGDTAHLGRMLEQNLIAAAGRVSW